jgi:hypothetical protein
MELSISIIKPLKHNIFYNMSSHPKNQLPGLPGEHTCGSAKLMVEKHD